MLVFVLSAFSIPGCDACNPNVEEVPDAEDGTRYAAAVCEAEQSCECSAYGEGPEDCFELSKNLFEDMAATPSMRFDPACFEDVLSFLDENPCSSFGDFSGCLVFHGAAGEGAPCSYDRRHPQFLAESECEPHLFCNDGVCTSPSGRPTNILPLGAECFATSRRSCESGTYCSTAGTCTSEKTEGEACDSPAACSSSLVCSGITERGDIGVCVQPPSSGEPCELSTPQSCGFALGELCRPDGSCGSEYPAVCHALEYPGGPYDRSEWEPWTAGGD